MPITSLAAPSSMRNGGRAHAVAEALDAARAAAVAAEEARIAAAEAEKKAATASMLAAIAAEKVGVPASSQDNAAVGNGVEEGANASDSLPHELTMDYNTHAMVRISLRYAIQEMRRHGNLLFHVNKIFSNMELDDACKIKKVSDHLDHIRKKLLDTATVCQDDLDKKDWSEVIEGAELEEKSNYTDNDVEESGYVSESSSVWSMVFQDQIYYENREARSIQGICEDMGWDVDEWWDRNM